MLEFSSTLAFCQCTSLKPFVIIKEITRIWACIPPSYSLQLQNMKLEPLSKTPQSSNRHLTCFDLRMAAFGSVWPTSIATLCQEGSLRGSFGTALAPWSSSLRACAPKQRWNNAKLIFATSKRSRIMALKLAESWSWWVLMPKFARTIGASWISLSRHLLWWQAFRQNFPGAT